MNLTHPLIATAVLTIGSSSALAALPHAHTWPMMHLQVSLNNNALDVHLDTDLTDPVEMLSFPGETYDGPAGVLDDQFYSDQYGWVLDGIVDPGIGNSIWIELTDQTSGLETYHGGMRSMIGMQDFNPLFGTDGSDTKWQWDGMMTHNWYAASALGDYDATYRLYIGDSTGNAVAGFSDASVTLNLRAVPTPSSLAMLGLGSLVACPRKRAHA